MTIHYDSTTTAPGLGTSFRGSTATLTRDTPTEQPTEKAGARNHPPRWQKTALVGAIVAGVAAVTVFVVSNDSGNDSAAVEVSELSEAQNAQAQRLAEQATAFSANEATATDQRLVDSSITAIEARNTADQPTVLDSSVTAIEARDDVAQPTVLDSSVTAIEAREDVAQPTVLDSSVTAIEARDDAAQPTVLDSSVTAIEAREDVPRPFDARTKRAIEADGVEATESSQ
ncbi:hypothetical protein [Ilumatobacter sp.]|uniref:hypothetical protein n=1 Tax=Ilumatobacter sp. TaxID=1967498 RepID=UPI003C481AAD